VTQKYYVTHNWHHLKGHVSVAIERGCLAGVHHVAGQDSRKRAHDRGLSKWAYLKRVVDEEQALGTGEGRLNLHTLQCKSNTRNRVHGTH
jgi:DUF971 family protein